MNKSFSGCEVVEMGIHVEENGRDFYSELATKAEGSELRSVFSFLAGEEQKHIETFDGIFKSTCDHEPEGAYTQEYYDYMKALSGQYVFTKKGTGREMAEKVKDLAQGLDLGIQFEKDSILFYQEMKNYVPEKDGELID